MAEENNKSKEQSQEGEENVKLDEYEFDSESSPENKSGEEDTSRSSQKVELDIDDASFLDWDEEEDSEEQVEEKKEEKEPEKKEEARLPFWKAWWFWLFLGLLAGVLISLFILLGQGKDTPEAEPEPKQEQQSFPSEEKKEKSPEIKELKVPFKEFWLEYKHKNKVRYLHFKFSVLTTNKQLRWEIRRKIPVLRDAVYYYLKNKELVFLADKSNAESLKSDIISIMNQFLSSGQINDLLLQKYWIE